MDTKKKMQKVPDYFNDPASPSRNRRRLWTWFLAGFVLVFVGLAAFYPIDFYDGYSLRATRLWHYYLLELQRESHASTVIGPTYGNQAAMMIVLAQHMLISVVAGFFTAGILWSWRRFLR